jgi:uncharacterized protein (DUF2164 family)
MRIRLSDDRRARVLAAVKRHFDAEFDDPISDFRANGLLDLFLRELGPAVYNQGVRDACGYVQESWPISTARSTSPNRAALVS